MRPSFLRHVLPLALLSAACAAATGCSAPPTEEAEESNDALSQTAEGLSEEVKMLGGGSAELRALEGLLDKRIEDLDGRKAAAKEQAKVDVDSYTSSQWARSFFRQDEMESAIDARAADIFDRPERRARAGAKAQKQMVEELLKLVEGGAAGSLTAPAPRAATIREGYVEIAIAISLNDELGFMKQAGARIGHILRKKFPWLGKIFKGLRRDHRIEGLEGEAVNIDRSGELSSLWKNDPIGSTAWHPRDPEAITPAKLYRGPWFGGAQPRLPRPDEVWKLAGFRSQAADGAHPAVDIAYGDAEFKLKFRKMADVFEEGPNARLLWALGYETDPQYALREVRVEPRAFIAAHTSVERIGLRFGPAEDEIIPARPPKGISITLNGMKAAPGGAQITIAFKDGHEETGDRAIDSLKRASDDRPFLDEMASVLVRKVYGEVDNPLKRDAIGPWDYDADNHVDDREIRAIGIILGAWLGNDDIKFNNVRLDVERPADGQVKYAHTISDSGKLEKDFGFTVGIDPSGRFLHPDTNAYTIKAFDRITANDAKWAIAKIAALSEDQIVACVASGALTDEGLALHVEKLVARRDELIKTFGLQSELSLMRPNGANRTPAPRHFEP